MEFKTMTEPQIKMILNHVLGPGAFDHTFFIKTEIKKRISTRSTKIHFVHHSFQGSQQPAHNLEIAEDGHSYTTHFTWKQYSETPRADISWPGFHGTRTKV